MTQWWFDIGEACMTIDRRAFLKLGGLSALAAGMPAQIPPADHTIRIATGLLELAPNRFISTTLYNDQFPGPLIRLQAGRPVVVDVHNDTEIAEQLHWHGQLLPVDVDGSAEEGTPFIPAHGHRRLEFTPGPAGLRFYHTHTFAGPDLRAGQYGGQVGLVYVEPRENAGDYDQEIFLVLKEFDPSLTRVGEMEMDFLLPRERDKALEATGESARKASVARGLRPGFEVEYRYATINGRLLGDGDPIRVKTNDRVLLHVVNGSATEIRSLALPGHVFHVIALDGNPVPSPADVPVLWIAPGERVSAVVQMSYPGVWVMSDVGEARFTGMGIVVEYAGATGRAEWIDPPSATWDYTRFGRRATEAAVPDERIDMVFSEEHAAITGFNRWLVNGAAFSMTDMKPAFSLRRGRRYRLRMRNASDDTHPIHLHRHIFELTRIAGQATSGILKDVVMLGAYQEMEIDFTANSPGLSLFHCHMQIHMDYGFMALFRCQ
jgi:FtsP/CotA-like multicopper oxidase with cupredoxin domain